MLAFKTAFLGALRSGMHFALALTLVALSGCGADHHPDGSHRKMRGSSRALCMGARRWPAEVAKGTFSALEMSMLEHFGMIRRLPDDEQGATLQRYALTDAATPYLSGRVEIRPEKAEPIRIARFCFGA